MKNSSSFKVNPLIERIDSLQRAIDRLEELLDSESTESFWVDALVHRFEFCVELSWKVLQKILASHNIEVGTPRDVIKASFKAKFIESDQVWSSMLFSRNQSFHNYDEGLARILVNDIQTKYFPMIKKLPGVLYNEVNKFT